MCLQSGIITKQGDGFECRPIVSKVINLRAELNMLNYAVPGGLIGVGTQVDPTLCRADRLVGQVPPAVTRARARSMSGSLCPPLSASASRAPAISSRLPPPS